MRIAMMTNNYKPFVGGVPISVERLSEGLRELGHEVYVFAPGYEGIAPEEGVIRCRSLKKTLECGCVVPDILDFEIERQFKRLDFDMIHVHHPVLMGYSALYLGKRYGVPVAFTYHTRYEQYLHNVKPFGKLEQRVGQEKNRLLRTAEQELVDLTKNRLVPAHTKVFSNLCDLVFAPTPAMEAYLREKGVLSPVEVLPTGLDGKDFVNDGRDKALREELRNGKQHLFITVSRLDKEKNLAFLLKGMQALKQRIGNTFRLLIIGDGPMREELQQLASLRGLEDNVAFLGMIDNREIGRYYRACDMFLFASKSETQGIVLLEAMAARLPVVAVDASGVCDIVSNGFNGYRTEEDEQVWAEKVSAVLAREGLQKELQRGAYTTALNYRAGNIARKAERSYERAIYRGRERRSGNVCSVY